MTPEELEALDREEELQNVAFERALAAELDWKRAERSGEKNDAGLLLGKLEAKRQRTGIH